MPKVTETTNVLLPFRSQAKSVSRVVLAFYLLSPNVLLADALISAASNNGPEFVTSANGTTVVNINKATAGGVSRNDYNTFNVSDKGLILNNSANIVNTTLAGHIDGNARLQGNSASIILNEVLGGSASNLNGYTEVAGQAAEVIIANQSGITCNGCGFINTTRGVLTTGQLQFEAGDFSGYNVTQGQINIEGEGLNAANIDQVDLLARSISLNGKVWADKLNAITGQNTIDHHNLEILSSTNSVDNQPGFSLDVSALGGMYANRIRLIGTENGLGVNTAGDLVAINKLQIDQSGKVTNSGTIATSDLEINATELSNNQNAVISAALSQFDIENELENEGTIKGEALTVNVNDLINAGGGVISSTDSIIINAIRSIDNSNATIEANGDIGITTENFNNQNEAVVLSNSGELNIKTTTFDNRALIEGDSVFIDADDFNNQGFEAEIKATNFISVDAITDINNTQGALIYSAGNALLTTEANLENSNSIIATGGNFDFIGHAFNNYSADPENNFAALQVTGNATLITDQINNSVGSVLATENGLLRIKNTGAINNTGLIAGAQVNITTDDILNSGADAQIQAKDSLSIDVVQTWYNQMGALIFSEGSASLTTQGDFYNHSGVVETLGTLNIGAQRIFNQKLDGYDEKSYLVSSDEMTLTGDVYNQEAAIKSGKNFTQKEGLFHNYSTGVLKSVDGEAKFTSTNWYNYGFVGGDSVNVTAKTIDNYGDKALVLAHDKLDMTTTQGDLRNRNGGVLYSFGAAVFDVENTLLNESSNIETNGLLSITADELINKRTVFITNVDSYVIDTRTNYVVATNLEDHFPSYIYDLIEKERLPVGTLHKMVENSTTTREVFTIEEMSQESFMLSGDSISLDIEGDIRNEYSTISALGNNDAASVDLINLEFEEKQIDTKSGQYKFVVLSSCSWHENCDYKGRGRSPSNPRDIQQSPIVIDSGDREDFINASSTISSNKNLSIEAETISNGNTEKANDSDSLDITVSATKVDGPVEIITSDIINNGSNLDDLSYGALFSQVDNANHGYLIETNTNFTEYQNFISSDYMLEKMGVDINESDNVRLGDGYFEQDLVRDQIIDLTGTQYIQNSKNIQDQYLALMNNGLDAKDDLMLSFGIALTAEQIQALNKPIVWMVEKQFATSNGSKTALVPQVYFSDAMGLALREDGALITADSINLEATNDIANAGIIKAKDKLKLVAENIKNTNKLASTNELELVSRRDINNASGLIESARVDINAGRDFINETQVDVLDLSSGNSTFKQTLIGNTATINANTLNITAGNDVKLIGSQLQVQSDLIVQAANNIEMTTAKIIEEAINGNYYNVSSVEHITTDIGAGTVLMLAGNTFTSEGATINATGDMSVSAKDINLLAVKNTEDKDIFNDYGGGNTNHTVSHTEAVVATKFNSAGVLSLNSSNSILSKGSQLSGTNGMDLAAGGDITLATEQAYNSSTVTTTSKKSGTFSSTRKTSTQKDESLTHTGTSLASDGHINMTSGNNITLTGSDLESGGNVELNAEGDVSLLAAVNDSFTQFTQTVKKTFTQKAKDSGSINQEAVGSNLTAQGNLTISSGGNTTIKGSDLTTAQTLTLGDQAVTKDENGNYINADGQQVGNVTVTTQALTNETWDKSSSGLRGVLADVASGLTAITASFGIETEIEVGRSSEDLTQDTTQQASNISAQDLNIDTSGNVAIIGSNVSVNDSASINANSLTIDAAKEQHTDSHASTKKTVSSAGASMGETEVSLLSLSETETTTTTTNQSTTWAGSTLEAGNLSVNVKETAAIISSDVNVEGDASIQAQDVLIGGRQDIATTTTDTETKTKTLTIGVKNAYADTVFAIDALNDAKNAVRDAKSAYNDAKQKIANGQMPASELKYFETNIAATTANVANATIALASAGAAAATSSGTAGFYATGTASNQVDKSSSTDTSNTWNGSSLNINGNANINAENEIKVKGSNVAVAGALQLDAEHINLLAGDNSTQSSSESSSHTESSSVSIKAPDAGGTNFSGSLNASKTEGSSESQYYTNTQIAAGTLSSDSKNLTLSGANVDAGAIDITTENLLVESLQNTATSNSETVGINAGFGKDGLSSAGINQQESNTSSAWVDQQSGITGGNVNITAKDTTLKGGLIAAIDQDGNDNGNLNLTTDTLSVENIQDHDTSSDKGISLSHSFDGTNAHEKNNPPKDSSDKMSTASTTIGGNYNGHDTRQTTSATLGSGNVKVGGQDIADTSIEVNRDIENAQEITQDHQLGGLDASVTVDHRLASEEGRDQISEDFMKTDMIRETIERIATTDKVGVEDFFTETGKQHDTYEGIKQEIAKDPVLAAKLQDPRLSAEDKQQMMNQLTHVVMEELGYETEGYENKVVSKNENASQGHYNEETGDTYINDQKINDTEGLIETAGHEMAHAMDDQDGSNKEFSKEDRETYAHNIGDEFSDYTDMALDINGYNEGMATTNNRVGNGSEVVIDNNQEYTALDKSKGDNYLTPEQQADKAKRIAACTTGACEANVVRNYKTMDDIQEFEKNIAKIKQIGGNIVDGVEAVVDTGKAVLDAIVSPMDTFNSMLDGIDNLSAEGVAKAINDAADEQHQNHVDREDAYIAGDSEALGQAEGNIASEQLAVLAIPGGVKIVNTVADILPDGKVKTQVYSGNNGSSGGDADFDGRNPSDSIAQETEMQANTEYLESITPKNHDISGAYTLDGKDADRKFYDDINRAGDGSSTIDFINDDKRKKGATIIHGIKQILDNAGLDKNI